MHFGKHANGFSGFSFCAVAFNVAIACGDTVMSKGVNWLWIEKSTKFLHLFSADLPLVQKNGLLVGCQFVNYKYKFSPNECVVFHIDYSLCVCASVRLCICYTVHSINDNRSVQNMRAIASFTMLQAHNIKNIYNVHYNLGHELSFQFVFVWFFFLFSFLGKHLKSHNHTLLEFRWPHSR